MLKTRIITAIMAAGSANSIPTFTLGFPQRNYDERSFALEVAEYLGTEHTMEEMGPEQAGALIPEILDHIDEPFGDTAILPNYAISKMASKRFTSSRSICCLKSGPASIMIFIPFILIKIELRKRLSFKSLDRHTSQLQPIRGTPCEVPVPRNVIFKFFPFSN